MAGNLSGWGGGNSGSLAGTPDFYAKQIGRQEAGNAMESYGVAFMNALKPASLEVRQEALSHGVERYLKLCEKFGFTWASNPANLGLKKRAPGFHNRIQGFIQEVETEKNITTAE
jgi:hypothetical protein